MSKENEIEDIAMETLQNETHREKTGERKPLKGASVN